MSDDNTQPVALRDERGRMLAPLPGTRPITHENARMLVEKRWANYRRAAVQRVTDEMRGFDPSIKGGADAWGMLVAKQAVALMDSDKPRGDDLYRIGQVMGALPTSLEARAAEAASASQTVNVQLPPEAAVLLVDLLRELAGRQVIDAEVSDG